MEGCPTECALSKQSAADKRQLFATSAARYDRLARKSSRTLKCCAVATLCQPGRIGRQCLYAACGFVSPLAIEIEQRKDFFARQTGAGRRDVVAEHGVEQLPLAFQHVVNPLLDRVERQKRVTVTDRFAPMRWARLIAWSSTAGFHQRSNRNT